MDAFHYPIKKDFELEERVSYFLRDDDGYINLSDSSQVPSLSVNKDKVLDLTGDEKKVIVQINHYVFGFLFQEIPETLLFYSRISNRKTKIYVNIINPIASSDISLSSFFIKYLNDLNIDVEIISDKDFKELKINNFYVLRGHIDPFYIKLLYSKVKKYIVDIKKEPFRKVYVSRKQDFQQRVDSNKNLEDFFIAAGFEVVHAEDFNDFVKQINYFSECKIIAGISGSGLSNSIFMKPGGTMIEISSLFDIHDDGTDVEIHHFYKVMADAKDHLYFSIPNLSGKSEKVIANKKVLDILELL
jgi:hypothetical protein